MVVQRRARSARIQAHRSLPAGRGAAIQRKPRKNAGPDAPENFPTVTALTPRPGRSVLAVSRELRAARQLLVKSLQFPGCEPVGHDI